MTLRRWFAFSGVASVVLIVAGFASGGSTPDDDASAAKVLHFYRAHENAQFVSAFLIGLAAVLMVLFASRLRQVLDAEGPGTVLVTRASFAGAAIFSAGLLFLVASHVALVQAAHYNFGASAQTLNVLDGNAFPLPVGGLILFLGAAGIATIRRPVIPRWLGWCAVVIAIAAMTPVGFVAILVGLAWVLIVSVLLLVKGETYDASEDAQTPLTKASALS